MEKVKKNPKITTRPALAKVKIYIDGQKKGLQKTQAAKLAGYSDSTARTTGVIDKSQAYQIMIRLTSQENAMSLHKLAKSISTNISAGDMGDKVLKKTQIMKNIAQIEDLLAPKVAVKETKDQFGKITKTTKWGSVKAFNDSMVGQVGDEDEDLDGDLYDDSEDYESLKDED